MITPWESLGGTHPAIAVARKQMQAVAETIKDLMDLSEEHKLGVPAIWIKPPAVNPMHSEPVKYPTLVIMLHDLGRREFIDQWVRVLDAHYHQSGVIEDHVDHVTGAIKYSNLWSHTYGDYEAVVINLVATVQAHDPVD